MGAPSRMTVKLMVLRHIQAAASAWPRLKGANPLTIVIDGVSFTRCIAECDTGNRAA